MAWPNPFICRQASKAYHQKLTWHDLCRFVSRKDPDANVVYVSRNYYDEDRRRDSFVCGGFNWIALERMDPAQPLFCKVRHGPNMYRYALTNVTPLYLPCGLHVNDCAPAQSPSQFCCLFLFLDDFLMSPSSSLKMCGLLKIPC